MYLDNEIRMYLDNEIHNSDLGGGIEAGGGLSSRCTAQQRKQRHPMKPIAIVTLIAIVVVLLVAAVDLFGARLATQEQQRLERELRAEAAENVRKAEAARGIPSGINSGGSAEEFVR